MIVDAHAHISNTEYGNINVLLNCMDESRIDKAILVPGGMIDVRRMSNYILHKEEPKLTEPPNCLVEEMIKKFPNKFFGFCCINPLNGDNEIEKFKNLIESGFSGLKLAPTVHKFSLRGKMIYKLAKICEKYQVPFYTHVTYSPAASTSKVGMLAKEFPDVNFIIGHMGFGPADIEAIEIAGSMENVYLETSGSSFIILKEAVKEIGVDKLIYGSEFPMYHPAVELKKIKLLDITTKDKEKIFSKNILNILPRR